MRILTFLHSFEPGGVERTALALASEWWTLGQDSIVWMGRRDGVLADRLDPALPIEGPAPSTWPVARFETLWMLWHLPAAVRCLKPDILFCAGNSYTIVAAWLRLRLGRHCPPIIAKISNDLKRRDMPLPARLLYRVWLWLQGRVIDQAVAIDAAMVAEIVRYLGHSPERVLVVDDPSIRLDQMTVPPLRDRHRRGRLFVSLGRLSAQKNYRLMIEAFAKGARPDDQLVIHGEGPDRQALERLIAQLGMAQQIALPGYAADPARVLADADIFLLSSAYEGVPAVIIEALANGLPIIATDCSASMAGLLGHGALGTLVEPSDGEGFADAIAAAEPAKQDIAAAHAMAARFTVERAGAAYLTLFRQTELNLRGRWGAPAPVASFQNKSLETDQPCC